MRLLSVIAARAVWFLDMEGLNPRGRKLFPDVVPELVEKFEFSGSPKTPNEMNTESKDGIIFQNGKFTDDNGLPISGDFDIYPGGVAVQTRYSTETSERILAEIVDFGVEKFGLTFNPSMIRRKAYVSQLVVLPEKDINKGLQKFNDFAGFLSGLPIGGMIKQRDLSTIGFKSEGDDRWTFTFERRANTPFIENKYYSICDVPTDTHIDILGRFEDLLSS